MAGELPSRDALDAMHQAALVRAATSDCVDLDIDEERSRPSIKVILILGCVLMLPVAIVAGVIWVVAKAFGAL